MSYLKYNIVELKEEDPIKILEKIAEVTSKKEGGNYLSIIRKNSMNNMKKEQEEQDLKESVYLDSNCFIYASISKQQDSLEAKKILEQIKNGIYKKAYTSVLTIDEFLWKVQKEVGRELSAEGAIIFFTLKNLELIDVNFQVVSQAVEIYKN